MNKIIGFKKEYENIFNNLLNDQISNSLLISGNKGIGKFLLINNLIEEYLKVKINNDQIHHHLTLFKNNSHPNIRIIKKEIDDKTKKIKNHISIDQVRRINQFSRETSLFENFPKFILIDSADDLNLNSSNALLKILEEPNLNTFFFLISHQPSTLIPTIKSRCLKINLTSHNFNNFKNIMSQEISSNDELLKFLFDITNGSPGLCSEYDLDNILEIFENIIILISNNDPFSKSNNNLIDLLSSFDNEKFKIYLSLFKFILIILIKIKFNINVSDYYLSNNILKIENISNNLSIDTIHNKLDYLINNENDLFNYNLDKKIFMINFFAQR